MSGVEIPAITLRKLLHARLVPQIAIHVPQDSGKSQKTCLFFNIHLPANIKLLNSLCQHISCAAWPGFSICFSSAPPPPAGSCQEPPDVCRARGGGDPQGADQRAGGEEQPAGEGELPAEEPGQPGADGEVPVSHPGGRAAGQPELPHGLGRAADPRPLRWICCVSGSALGRAEPLPLDKNGPPL